MKFDRILEVLYNDSSITPNLMRLGMIVQIHTESIYKMQIQLQFKITIKTQFIPNFQKFCMEIVGNLYHKSIQNSDASKAYL